MKYKSYSGETSDYSMRIYTDTNGEYCHIYADFFVYRDNEKTHSHDLSNFRVYCQTDKENIQKPDPFYAINFEFTDDVNCNNWKEVSAILKYVGKGLTDYSNKFGYIQGIAEYLFAVCLTIGIKEIEWNNQSWQAKDIKWIIANFIQSKRENWYSKQ